MSSAEFLISDEQWEETPITTIEALTDSAPDGYEAPPMKEVDNDHDEGLLSLPERPINETVNDQLWAVYLRLCSNFPEYREVSAIHTAMLAHLIRIGDGLGARSVLAKIDEDKRVDNYANPLTLNNRLELLDVALEANELDIAANLGDLHEQANASSPAHLAHYLAIEIKHGLNINRNIEELCTLKNHVEPNVYMDYLGSYIAREYVANGLEAAVIALNHLYEKGLSVSTDVDLFITIKQTGLSLKDLMGLRSRRSTRKYENLRFISNSAEYRISRFLPGIFYDNNSMGGIIDDKEQPLLIAMMDKKFASKSVGVKALHDAHILASPGFKTLFNNDYPKTAKKIDNFAKQNLATWHQSLLRSDTDMGAGLFRAAINARTPETKTLVNGLQNLSVIARGLVPDEQNDTGEQSYPKAHSQFVTSSKSVEALIPTINMRSTVDMLRLQNEVSQLWAEILSSATNIESVSQKLEFFIEFAEWLEQLDPDKKYPLYEARREVTDVLKNLAYSCERSPIDAMAFGEFRLNELRKQLERFNSI